MAEELFPELEALREGLNEDENRTEAKIHAPTLGKPLNSFDMGEQE